MTEINLFSSEVMLVGTKMQRSLVLNLHERCTLRGRRRCIAIIGERLCGDIVLGRVGGGQKSAYVKCNNARGICEITRRIFIAKEK